MNADVWTGKTEIKVKSEFLAVGKACKTIEFIPGLKGELSDRPQFSLSGPYTFGICGTLDRSDTLTSPLFSSACPLTQP